MSNTDSFNLVVNSGAPEGYSIPAPQVTPVTLLKIMTKSMQEIEVNGQ
jgi:hypothetical protein